MKPLRSKQVDPARLRTDPYCFSIRIHAINRVAIDSPLSLGTVLTDERKRIRLTLIDINPVQRRYNYMPLSRHLNVRDVSLAQHTRTVGRVTIATHQAGRHVVSEKSPVRPYPKEVPVFEHTRYPPVLTERLQTVRQRYSLQ